MVQMELYNIRDPPWRGDRKFVRENTVAVLAIYVTIFNQYIYKNILPQITSRTSLLR